MRIALLSESQDAAITPAVLGQIAAALEMQLYEHYAPFWQSGGVDVFMVIRDRKSVV